MLIRSDGFRVNGAKAVVYTHNYAYKENEDNKSGNPRLTWDRIITSIQAFDSLLSIVKPIARNGDVGEVGFNLHLPNQIIVVARDFQIFHLINIADPFFVPSMISRLDNKTITDEEAYQEIRDYLEGISS